MPKKLFNEFDDGSRHYTFGIVSYADRIELDGLLQAAHHWCLIKHDADVDSEGAPKPSHYHVIATFQANQSYRQVADLVKSKSNTLVKHCEDVAGLYDYLTHETAEAKKDKKHIYPREAIEHDDPRYWENRVDAAREQRLIAKQEKHSAEELISDLCSDNYSVIEMAKKYGRDYIRNMERYELFRSKARQELAERARTERENADRAISAPYMKMSYNEFYEVLTAREPFVLPFGPDGTTQIRQQFGGIPSLLQAGITPTEYEAYRNDDEPPLVSHPAYQKPLRDLWPLRRSHRLDHIRKAADWDKANVERRKQFKI